MCGATEGLQLHHMTYERIGAEELTDLIPLCETCHNIVHVLDVRGEMALDFAGLVDQVKGERHRQAIAEREQAEQSVRTAQQERVATMRERMPLGWRLDRVITVMHLQGRDTTKDRRVWHKRLQAMERDLGLPVQARECSPWEVARRRRQKGDKAA